MERGSTGMRNVWPILMAASILFSPCHWQSGRLFCENQDHLQLLAATLSVAWVLTGCQSPPAEPPSGSSAPQSTRNNCYSLLHQLLDEQKDVSMLRFIKKEHSDVKDLIKRIATASGTGSNCWRNLPNTILRSIYRTSGFHPGRQPPAMRLLPPRRRNCWVRPATHLS
jgi:hypothetical protein